MPIPRQEWRKWYKTKEWYRIKATAHKRDSVLVNGKLVPKCRQTGQILDGKYPAPNSPVADHIQRHRGDPDLFFNLDNIQTVSMAYHVKQKQRQERRGYAKLGPDGWPA